MAEDKDNYKEIGLKAGLEIHQQLNTNKLFCNCPSILRNDTPMRLIERKLNPVIGEMGDIDIAAEYEKEKDKKFVYKFYDTNCLVELDEEPPHSINLESVKIALQIALLLNCKIFPVTQVMRKTVIDGSNTSGFQRTALIAHDGFIETSEGQVGIEIVALEEDAARIVERTKEKDIYNLDRLGIPLVEIATKPELHSPEQIKEAALKIGEILRACNVKRGIGTIRQDLNISIKGSERVEIKGFQDPKVMIQTVENEIKRQKDCVKNKKCKKEVRKANPDATTDFLRPMPGSARMYPETDVLLLKISREMADEAKKTLPKLSSEHKSYLKEYGLNDELIKLILNKNKTEDFKSLLSIINNPNLVAKTLVIFPLDIANKENKSEEEIEKILTLDVIETVLGSVALSKISENDVSLVLKKIVSGESLQSALKKEKIDLKSEIEKLIKEKPGLNQGAYMGLVMGKFKGRVNGKEVADELNALMPRK